MVLAFTYLTRNHFQHNSADSLTNKVDFQGLCIAKARFELTISSLNKIFQSEFRINQNKKSN